MKEARRSELRPDRNVLRHPSRVDRTLELGPSLRLPVPGGVMTTGR